MMMRRSTCVAAFLVALTVLVCAADAQAPKIEVLNEDSLRTLAQDRQYFLLVNVFATWSVKSKEFSSEFAKVPELLTELNFTAEQLGRIRIGKLNGVKYNVLTRALGVRHYPTVLLFNGNLQHHAVFDIDHTKHIEYKADGVVEFASDLIMKQHARESLDEEQARLHIENYVEHPGRGRVAILDGTNFTRYALDLPRLVLVFFHAPWCQYCQRLHEAVANIAKYFENDFKVLIAKVNGDDCDDLMSKYNVEQFPTFIAFPKGGHGKVGMKYTNVPDEEHIRAWMDTLNQGGYHGEDHTPFHTPEQHDEPNHGIADENTFLFGHEHHGHNDHHEGHDFGGEGGDAGNVPTLGKDDL